MKKILSFIVILALSLSPITAALASIEGEYEWNGLSILITDMDVNPTFDHGNKTDDECAVILSATVPVEAFEDGDPVRELFNHAILTDGDGAVYRLRGAGVDEKKGHLFLFYYIAKGVDADTLIFQFAPAMEQSVPAEYVGEWFGSAGGIDLTFRVNADGTGVYTFEQSGYFERYDFTLTVESESFSVEIPQDNQLGIVSCEGTYAYADGVMTLDIETTFAGGRVFSYTMPCERVD